MPKKQLFRKKGKIPFSKYFQKLSEGDRVAVVRELSVNASFPKNIQGNTGVIKGKQGKAYIIEIKNKKYLIEPVHLKKIKT